MPKNPSFIDKATLSNPRKVRLSPKHKEDPTINRGLPFSSSMIFPDKKITSGWWSIYIIKDGITFEQDKTPMVIRGITVSWQTVGVGVERHNKTEHKQNKKKTKQHKQQIIERKILEPKTY